MRITGFAPERFMNLCVHRGIYLWDIEKQLGSFELCLSIHDFFKLKDVYKKTGCRVVVLEKYGLPFFRKKMKRRKAFICGMIFAVIFWYVSGFFVWDICLTGNGQITEEEMNRFLHEKNVYIGMLKSKIDLDDLEKQIRVKYNRVIWTCAKITGTRLYVEIKENEHLQENEKQLYDASNLLSVGEGEILSILVREGIPNVKKGDMVKENQILVEGLIPIWNEDQTVKHYEYVNADADIVCKRKISKTFALNTVHIKKVYTGRKKTVMFLKFDQKTISLPTKVKFLSYDIFESTKSPTVFSHLGIPFFIGTTQYMEYFKEECEFSYGEAKALLDKKNSLFMKSLEEKGVQIIEKNVKIEKAENKWILQGEYEILDSRTKTQPIDDKREDLAVDE